MRDKVKDQLPVRSDGGCNRSRFARPHRLGRNTEALVGEECDYRATSRSGLHFPDQAFTINNRLINTNTVAGAFINLDGRIPNIRRASDDTSGHGTELTNLFG